MTIYLNMQKNFWLKLKTPSKGGQAILALAPMAGITDSIFRRLCKEYGADVVYSEMASASALFFHFRNKNTGPKKSNRYLARNRKIEISKELIKPEKTLKLVEFEKSESPYIVQLFGKNPEHFARATQIITEKIKPDGIDINFGCPAPKVFREGAGCSLMLDKKLSRKIIKTVCENTHLPVSIKIRSGIKNFNALDFMDYLKDLPFSAVMIHGRNYEKMFSGPVDFEIMEKIKAIMPDKIVLGNGGINSAEDAINTLKSYPSLDGLGIARGALGKPFIFTQIKELLGCHPERSVAKSKDLIGLDSSIALGMTNSYDFSKIKEIMIHHAEMIWQKKKEAGIVEMRTHLSWYVKGIPNAAELRQKLMRVNNLQDINRILKKY
jgi:tRNA-dihydrouridine synthase B